MIFAFLAVLIITVVFAYCLNFVGFIIGICPLVTGYRDGKWRGIEVWEPTGTVVHVRREDGLWVADGEDRERIETNLECMHLYDLSEYAKERGDP